MSLRILALLAFVVALVPSQSMAYAAIASFGDSLSDTGNAYYANTAEPGIGVALGYLVPWNPIRPPYPFPPDPNGTRRFTNGDAPVGIELAARQLGLRLPASRGPRGSGPYVNYAIGGATSGLENYSNVTFRGGPLGESLYPGLAETGLLAQVDEFQDRLAGAPARPDALYFVWAGANDVFLALANAMLNGVPFDAAALIAETTGNLAQAIDRLYALGARDFLVANMPDLGRTPAFNRSETADDLSAFSAAFNAVLDQQIEGRRALPGIALFEADVLGLLNAVVADPARFGFANWTDACLSRPVCTPADDLFWDDVHPTARAHLALGALFASALGVPEPGALALLGLALLCAGVAARRRRQIARFVPTQYGSRSSRFSVFPAALRGKDGRITTSLTRW